MVFPIPFWLWGYGISLQSCEGEIEVAHPKSSDVNRDRDTVGCFFLFFPFFFSPPVVFTQIFA